MGMLGHTISYLINSLILSLVYFIAIGPTVFIARLRKKHFLDLKLHREAKTYWIDLNLGKKPIEKYYRQF